jgi:hypothetical protein
VSRALERHGITAVLVGGACVAIYSENRYVSGDLDFVTEVSPKKLAAPLGELGFRPVGGRHFEHPECRAFLIDFPAPPLSLGSDTVGEINSIRTPWGMIHLLNPTDCVRDRLAAYYHWDDPQGLEQALLVARLHNIDLACVGKWSLSENAREKFAAFRSRLRQQKST